MEYLALTLLILGALFLIIEFFVPGFGFFGVVGIIMMIVSAVLTIAYMPFGALIVVAEAAVLLLMVYIAVDYVKHHGSKSKIILNETLKEDKNDVEYLRSLVGREGITRTPLKPFGNIVIDDKYIEACSDGDFINAGERVLAIKEYENKLYVRKLS